MKNLQKTLIASIFAIGATASLTVAAKDANTENVENHAAESLISSDAKIVQTLYKDLDQDNVQDQLDHCPNTLMGATVDQFGCELDTGQDGVFDREGDADSDGVLDSKDACFNTPEGATVNKQGCEPMSIVISNIIFDTAKHEIRPDQAKILRKQAAALSDLKEGDVILITGHTDARGSIEMNERLSWRRANSTKDFIVAEFGISAERVFITGKGEMEPVSDNTTVPGRQENRRIQFKIIPQEELPEPVSLTLPKGMEKK